MILKSLKNNKLFKMSSLIFDPQSYQSFQNILNQFRYHAGQELEIRFGTFKSVDESRMPNFFPGVSATDFNRLMNNLSKSKLYSLSGQENRKVTYYNNSYRLIEILDENNMIKSQTLEEKKRIRFADLRGLNPYSFRFALSSERQQNLSLLSSLTKESIKYQKRYMYLSNDKKHSIHLTTVQKESEFSYDVEIESTGDYLLKEGNYIPVLKTVYKLLTNKFSITSSKIQYDFIKKQGEVVENLRQSDDKLRYERQNYTIDNKPVAVYFNNAHHLQKGYVVSNKLDGVYYNIVISKHGVALVNTSEVQIIFNIMQKEKLYQNANLNDNTILVGELYNNELYIFDVIMVDGEQVFNKKYTERLSHRLLPRIYKEFTNISNIPIKNKIIKYSDNVIEDIKKVIDESPQYYNINDSFESFNDGIIFTKEDGSYYDETYKWKFPDRISIDGKISLVTESEDKKIFDVYFKKSRDSLAKLSSQDQLIVNSNSTFFKILKDGMIVELGWNNGFIPERIRDDKILPNAILTAENTFVQMKNPMSLEQLYQVIVSGPSLEHEISINQAQVKNDRFRRFCNLMKMYLINTYCKENSNVLDLGSGKGGDLYKYEKRHLNKLFLVEPYLYDGLLERLSSLENNNYKQTITTINTAAESKDTIQSVIGDNKIDTITMMFSMTFFGEDDKFNKLRNTLSLLREDGNFVTTYMDGDRTLEKLKRNNGLFEGSFFKMQDINAIQLAKKSLGFGHKIRVAIQGESITLDGQEEFLLPSSVINSKLNLSGFGFTSSLFFDNLESLSNKESKEIKEAIQLYNQMSDEEKELVSLFRFDVYKKSSDQNKKQQLIEVQNALESLPPKTHRKISLVFEQQDEKFIRIGAIGEGSCFFHAALQAIVFLEYYKLDKDTNKELVKFLRQSISDIFTKADWINIQNGDIAVYTVEEELSKSLSSSDYSKYLEVRKTIDTKQNYFVNTYKAIKSLKFSINLEEIVNKCFEQYKNSLKNDWIRGEHLEYLSKLLETNFIIIRDLTRDVYIGSGVSYNPEFNTIIILNLDGKYGQSSPHYETIVRVKEGVSTSLFTNDDELIHRLLKRLEKNTEVVEVLEEVKEEVDEKMDEEKVLNQRLQDQLRNIVKKHFMSKNTVDIKFELVEYKKKDLTSNTQNIDIPIWVEDKEQYVKNYKYILKNFDIPEEEVDLLGYERIETFHDETPYWQRYYISKLKHDLKKRKELEAKSIEESSEHNRMVSKVIQDFQDSLVYEVENIEIPSDIYIADEKKYKKNYKNIQNTYGLTKDEMSLLERRTESFYDYEKEIQDMLIDTIIKKREENKPILDEQLRQKLMSLKKNNPVEPVADMRDEWYQRYTPASNLEDIFKWKLYKYFGFKGFEEENFFKASPGYLDKILKLDDSNCRELFEEFARACYIGNIKTLEEVIHPEFYNLFLICTLEIYAKNIQKKMGLDALTINAIVWFNYFNVNKKRINNYWERLIRDWYDNKSWDIIAEDVADLEEVVDTGRYYSEIQPESNIRVDRRKYPEEQHKLYSIFSQYRICGKDRKDSRIIKRENIDRIHKDREQQELQRQKNLNTITKKYNLSLREKGLISTFLIDNYHILDKNEREFHLNDLETYRKNYKKIQNKFNLTESQMNEISYDYIRFYELREKYVDEKIAKMFA